VLLRSGMEEAYFDIRKVERGLSLA
jgi:hypothetical protein